ncbi:hypothetical protein ASD62_03815 [Phycicoccus sp. Root563]|uniref:helix-turn-helix domain-containing protein n=1 Tax=Phycicoccus sp. Root563 TaxID=1736562 RepID=UPI000703C031|nr:helix-turn-helix domain-containing protein [Phycicoccus sp. Root563]KQZ88567.1 hypothetical protein ASD62_03815 [Phycicoccus sp. Root563]
MGRRSVAGLREAHDRVLAGEDDARVSDQIAASWRRAVAQGIDPERQRPRRFHEVDDTVRLRAEHPLAPYIPVVTGLLGDSSISDDHLVVVTDVSGEVLWRIGSAAALRVAESIEFVEGANWSEGGIGTNAISQSLVTGSAVDLVGGQHLVHSHHGWLCSAAPITDPGTGDMVAVLDVSAPVGLEPVAAGALVRTAARLIEEMMRGDALRRRAQSQPALRAVAQIGVNLLGARPTVRVGGVVHELTPRRADILALLTSREPGWSADELAGALYGDRGVPSSVRAEVHRLREVLGPRLESSPYRLGGDGVSVDVWSVRRALAAGDLTRALERYAGPLRPGSGSLEVALLRAELHETLRGAVLRSGDAGLLARWVDGGGADDVAALEALLAALPVGSLASSLYAARLARLDATLR